MPQNAQDPQDDLDNALRRLARETHPRRDFSARLRRELSTQPPRPATGPGLFARLRAALSVFLSGTGGLRPWLGQGLLVVLMVGLVLLSGALAGRLLDPGSGGRPGQLGQTGTPIPGQPIASDLPAGALARLGKGQIRSLDVAADGRLAVGSSAGVCLYHTGMTISWCRWTTAPVAGALFSPAGDRLAVRYTGSATAEVWDAASGQVLAARSFVPPAAGAEAVSAEVLGIAWEPAASVAAGASTDAPRLAVASLGAELALWDWSADTLAWGPMTLPADALDVAWAAGPNGESLLAVLTQHSIDLYDGQTGQIKSMVTTPANATEQNRSALIAMSLAPNGQQIAIDSAQGIETISLAGWQFIETQRLAIPYHGERLAFSPDSRQLAVVSDDQVMILNSSTTSSAPSFSARPFSPLAWSATENGVFYAAPDGSLATISAENQGLIPTGHVNPLQRIAWVGDQTLTAGGGRYLYSWNTGSTELSTISEVSLPATADLVGLTTNGQAGYLDLANRSVAQLDVVENRLMSGITAVNGLLAAAIAPDGQHMAAVETGGLIFILQIESDAVDQHDLSGIRGLTQVNGLAFQPNGADGDLLAVAYTTADGPGLDLWHTTRDKKAASLPVDGPINGLAWSPDGRWLAVLQDFQILVFDAASFDLLGTLQPNPADMLRSDVQPWPFSALAISPDGAYLAAAARKLTVYDLTSGQITREFSGQPQPVVDLAYRPDGHALASASQDGTILIWDLGAGPAAPVEPQPTATPLAAPPVIDTPQPYPAPRQSPEAVDLNNYDVSVQHWQSPSGAWTIQTLHGEWTERAPRPEDYNQFTVYDADFHQKWSIEEWPAHSMGEGRPARFTWSAGERYFYIDDRVTTDNCAGVAYQNLRRIDLATGQIERVLPYGPEMSGVYSLSPDGERLAGVLSAHIEIHNLTTGQPERKLFLEKPTTDTRPYDATAPVWSPDGTRLAVVLFEPSPLCQQANAETTLALIELANGDSHRLDFPPDGHLTGWRDANTLTLVDSQGFERLLSVESGQVISDPLQEEACQALAEAVTAADDTVTASSDGGYRTLRWMSVPELIRDQPGAERLRVWAEFNAQDGSLLSENQESRSNFTLQRLADGRLHVLDPLPGGPGGYTPRPYAAHLTSAEVQGLDETGVLRALVEEWLQTWRSPYASWRSRILYYDVLEIRPATSRSTAEQVSQLPASVVFSVQPAQMMYSDWVAGNGQIGSGWIRQKALFIRAVIADETVHLDLIGTGP